MENQHTLTRCPSSISPKAEHFLPAAVRLLAAAGTLCAILAAVGIVLTVTARPGVAQGYPAADINRPQRTGVESIIVLMMGGANYLSGPNIVTMWEKLNLLAQLNSYNLPNQGYRFSQPATHSGFPYFPINTTSASPINITNEFNQTFSPRLETYDRVVCFFPPGAINGQVFAVDRFVFFDGQNKPVGSGQDMDWLAAAVFHEMGHGSSTNHAFTIKKGWLNISPSMFSVSDWPENNSAGCYSAPCDPSICCPPPNNEPCCGPSCVLDYGEFYDYMGGLLAQTTCDCLPGVCRRWRFRNPPLTNVAAPTNIHANPIHKLQHGWIQNGDILPVTAAGMWQVEGISKAHVAGKYRALKIERGFAPSGAHKVLLVYYRDNEPKAAGGVCLALVSPDLVDEGTQLIEYSDLVPETGSYGVLKPGQTFCDSVSNAVITLDPPNSGDVTVHVAFGVLGCSIGSALSVPILPILNVQLAVPPPNPQNLIATRSVLTSGTLDISIQATTEPGLPAHQWKNVTRLEMDVQYGGGGMNGVVNLPSVNTNPEKPLTITQSFDLDLLPLHFVGTCRLEVRAYTTAPEHYTRGSLRFFVQKP